MNPNRPLDLVIDLSAIVGGLLSALGAVQLSLDAESAGWKFAFRFGSALATLWHFQNQEARNGE